MPEVRTFCRVCEPACGLVATVEEGTLRKLLPDRAHPVTKGFACNKGLAGVEIHLVPDRLAHPLRRSADGKRERIGWDTAVSEIAAKVRGIVDRNGAQAVSAYIGNPTAFNTLAGPAAGAFFAQLGVRRQFSSGTQDCANKFAGSEAVFGTSTCHPVPDFAHTEFLLIFGANPRVSHASFISVPDPMRWLKDAKKRGAKIYFVNPREIESSGDDTGETIRIRPDTDVYFMAALLHELDRTGGFDEAALAAHGRNVPGLRAFVARYDAERQAAVTGVPAAVVRRLAREMAAADGAAVHMSTGVNMGRQGTLAYWLLHMLSFATGNLDRRGGNILSVGFYDKAVRAGRRSFADGFSDTEWGRLRRGSLPGNLLADAILAEENPVRALFVVAGNPLLSIGGETRLREAFEKLELLVVVDLYQNATGEYADYLLPSTDAFERADVNITGLGLQEVPWIQFTDAVVAPRDERREEWWIFARLAQAMGLKSPLDAGPEPDLWGRIDHMLKSTGHSLAEVREAGGVLALDPLAPGRFFTEQLQTEDGKVDCCPDAFAGALERAEAIFTELAGEGLGRLKLITRRDPYMHNSWYQNLPSMKRGERDRNRLYVHPEDARERDLEDGAKVRVSNAHGALDVEIAYDAGLMRGVVALTHGWGNKQTTGMRFAARTPGVNANALLPSGPGSFEPLSSQAFMTGIPVEIAAL
jgi:anaerobic selenocysteine-containing dehydrogenase